MKTLRHIILPIGIGIIIIQMFSSCEEMFGDYLDKPPGVDVTEDTIFATRINAETFLTSIYAVGVETGYPTWDDWNGRRGSPWPCFTDQGEEVAAWYSCQMYNSGDLTPYDGGPDGRGRWRSRWVALRKIGIFLDRVYDVADADSQWKDQAAGQAMFIRALCYFDMFKMYGGVPVIRTRLSASIDDPDAIRIPRSSVEETVEFIVEQCDAAAELLPDSWPSEDVGRATKGAALLLKAKTLLYAASPLSNTDSPVVPLPGHNELICYGNYDVNRWQLAADAAQAVIDWAPKGGKKLIDDREVHPEWGVIQNYFDAWHEPDNVESIFAAKNIDARYSGATLWKGMNNFYTTQGGIMVLQNFVEKYEKRDGTPQTWNPAGGDNLAQLLAELDPRFVQSVAYVGSYWNVDFPELALWETEDINQQKLPPRLGNLSGYWQRKMIPPEMREDVPGWPVWNVLRLAEAYLIKAEALNEAQGPVPEAYAAVNIIRARSGMPDFPPGLSQEEFRIKIQNERSIELYAENNRLWDVIRWVIADKNDPVTGKAICNGKMKGIIITKQPEPSTEFSWKYKDVEDRIFLPRMYHWPFRQEEVNKGYLIQNPGY